MVWKIKRLFRCGCSCAMLGLVAFGTTLWPAVHGSVRDINNALVEADLLDEDDSPLRNLLDFAPIDNFKQFFDGYGCWCFLSPPEAGHNHHGTPRDELDVLCKALIDGYQCAVIDHQDDVDECYPWNVTYTAISTQFSGLALTARCDFFNQGASNSCARAACAVEGHFVNGVISLLQTGRFWDDNLVHTNGFDPEIECLKNDIIPGRGIRKCCGRNPFRIPFSTRDGAKDCCIGNIYDTSVKDCCNGQTQGPLVDTGTCPP